MKFPVSVEHIGDQIYLFQGEITLAFKKQLNNIDRGMGILRIQSSAQPQIDDGNIIYINGTDKQHNYSIETVRYNKDLFNSLKKSIEYYRKAMNYDE